MHEPVREHLEEYLGSSGHVPRPLVEDHLVACEPCREAVAAMRRQSVILQTLRAPNGAEPGAGFYAKVMERIDSQSADSVWNVFLHPFGRRVAYASAVLLLMLGGYIYTLESDNAAAAPESVLAGAYDRVADDRFANNDQQQQRDALLVNLASYDESGSTSKPEATYQ